MAIKVEQVVFHEKAQDLFTDREDPRKVFEDTYNGLNTGESDIINFYGVGGTGKTTLLNKIQQEMIEKDNDRFIYTSFENSTVMKTFLYILSRKMMYINRKLTFPRFEYAFLKHCKLVDENAEQLINSYNNTIFNKDGFKMITTVADEFIPFMGLATFAVENGFRYINEKFKHYKYRDIVDEIDSLDAGQIIKRLPKYFAKDAENNSEKIVIMLDGYETLVNTLIEGDKAEANDWWLQELVRYIPNILWVIAGREKLNWPTSLINKDQMHLLDELCEEDTKKYFNEAGINDEKLTEYLYKLTNGTPVYMDICRDQYYSVWLKQSENQKDPSEVFGKDSSELARRYLRDMSQNQQLMIYMMACLPRPWNDDMARKVAESLNYMGYWEEYKSLLKLSLVQKSDEGYTLNRSLQDAVRKYEPAQDKITEILSTVKKVLSDSINDEASITLQQSLIEMHTDNIAGSAIIEKKDVSDTTEYIHKCFNAGDYDFALKLIDRLLKGIEGKENLRKEVISCKSFKISILYELGEYKAAKRLGEDVLSNATEILNVDDEVLLESKRNFAFALGGLGEYKQEKDLLEEVYETNKRIYGEKSLNTLSSLANLAGIYAQLGEKEKAKDLTEKSYEGYKGLLGENHQSTLLVLGNLATEYVELGDYENARNLATKAYEGQKKIFGEDHPETLRTLDNLANIYSDLGDIKKARELSDKAYKGRVRALGEHHPKTIETLNNLAVIYSKLGDMEKAKDLTEKAFEEYKGLLGENHPTTLLFLGNLAIKYAALGDYENARNLATKAYESQKKIYGEDHQDTLRTLDNLANIYSDLGDMKKARELSEKAYEGRVRALGEHHPKTIETLNNLSNIYSDLGEKEKAKDLTEKAYEEYKGLLGENHQNTLLFLGNLATKYAALGDYENARNLATKAYEGQKKIFGEDHPETLRTLSCLSNIYSDLGDMKKARELCEKAYEGRVRVLGEHHPDTIGTLNGLSCIYAQQGEKEKAKDLTEKAYEEYKGLLGEDHPNTLIVLSNLPSRYAALGDYENARNYATEAYEGLKRIFGEDYPLTQQTQRNLAIIDNKLGDMRRLTS